MSANLDSLDPDLAAAARDLVSAAGAAGLLPRVTSTLRTHAEQTRLFNRRQQGLQQYYVAPPGSSSHEYGWAFDMVVSPFDAIYDVGATWKSWGGGWSESDVVHFELPGAAAEARRLGSQLTPEQTWSEWFIQKYNEIPWWASAVLPIGTTLQSATGPSPDSWIKRALRAIGLG